MSTAAPQRPPAEGAFKRGTMLLIIAIGTLAFMAMLLLGAYGPDLKSGKNGGAHALSNAATGFSAIVRLAAATGRDPIIVRSLDDLDTEDLVIVTPETAATNLDELLQRRGSRVTLIVLPKWSTERDDAKAGWVRVTGLLPKDEPEGVLAPSLKLNVARHKTAGARLRIVPLAAAPELRLLAPSVAQSIAAEGLEPLITDDQGRVVLARTVGRPLYILSEPDLLNNHGMGDARQAAGALAMLDHVNSTDATSILFDVTANGFGRTRSPLKLAFDPPFLAVTLTIFAAMLLAALQALTRFGSPSRAERAIAFGKAALIDNTAALIRKAGREARLGGRYAEVIRQRAVELFNLPASSDREALDQRLDALGSGKPFTTLAAAAEGSRNREEILRAAQSLHKWLEEVE